MKIDTIAEIWESFKARVMPPGAGPVQIAEMRRTFFSGSASMFWKLTGDVVALSDDEARTEITKLDKEIKGFVLEMASAALSGMRPDNGGHKMELPRILPANWHPIKCDWRDYVWESLSGIRVVADIEKKDDGRKWKHVSFSRVDRLPSYDDIKEVKEIFFGPNEWAIQVFPEAKNFVNCHPYCLHLWGCAEKIFPEFSRNGMI